MLSLDLIINSILIFFMLLFSGLPAEAQERNDIRILLLENRHEIHLKAQAPVSVRNSDTGKLLWKGGFGEIKITPAKKGIRLGKKIFPQRIVTVESTAPMAIGKRQYRGLFQIWNQGTGKLALINVLDLEDYLRGTMRSEISPLWPIPALKAQAVAARGYALYRRQAIRKKTKRPYDLSAGVSSQVYTGIGGEHERSSQAVTDTAGEVLFNQKGDVLETVYHACCGGDTESAQDVWGGGSDLKSVSCTYCADSPHYAWQSKVSIQEFIKTWFGQIGIGGALTLKPLRFSPNGRWQDILIRYGNRTKEVRGVDFRTKTGVDVIRSTRLKVKVRKNALFFSGRGWGHGVGLCQWGARGMAQNGATYKEVLSHYYPLSRPGTVTASR